MSDLYNDSSLSRSNATRTRELRSTSMDRTLEISKRRNTKSSLFYTIWTIDSLQKVQRSSARDSFSFRGFGRIRLSQVWSVASLRVILLEDVGDQIDNAVAVSILVVVPGNNEKLDLRMDLLILSALILLVDYLCKLDSRLLSRFNTFSIFSSWNNFTRQKAVKLFSATLQWWSRTFSRKKDSSIHHRQTITSTSYWTLFCLSHMSEHLWVKGPFLSLLQDSGTPSHQTPITCYLFQHPAQNIFSS